MDKEQFLKELEDYLAVLDPEKRDGALKFYREYFDKAGDSNELSVILELGNPYNLAKSIIAERSTPLEKGANSGIRTAVPENLLTAEEIYPSAVSEKPETPDINANEIYPMRQKVQENFADRAEIFPDKPAVTYHEPDFIPNVKNAEKGKNIYTPPAYHAYHQNNKQKTNTGKTSGAKVFLILAAIFGGLMAFSFFVNILVGAIGFGNTYVEEAATAFIDGFNDGYYDEMPPMGLTKVDFAAPISSVQINAVNCDVSIEHNSQSYMEYSSEVDYTFAEGVLTIDVEGMDSEVNLYLPTVHDMDISYVNDKDFADLRLYGFTITGGLQLDAVNSDSVNLSSLAVYGYADISVVSGGLSMYDTAFYDNLNIEAVSTWLNFNGLTLGPETTIGNVGGSAELNINGHIDDFVTKGFDRITQDDSVIINPPDTNASKTLTLTTIGSDGDNTVNFYSQD
ncbi:MAG: DUF1700 domain-containing protein [Ruminococcus sp.]|nr:DUF1700 domain-containing protein [Ruminococcus sp.]